jgi:hypothetical protein
MRRLIVLLLILVVGGAILAPLVMMFEPDPMPGDFAFVWANQDYTVPVLWSLCASGAIALLYSVFYR